MAKRTTDKSLTAVIRRAILDSDLSMKALAAATGVQRMSLSRFAAGERSLRLDMADKLASYFGLELIKRG